MKISAEQTAFPLSPTVGKTTATTTAATDKALELERLRLHKATKELESYFVLHMLKAMREAIPKSDLLSGGLGQDMYTSLFDEELSKTMSGGPGSLAEALYRSLEKRLTAESISAASATAAGERRTDVADGPGTGPPTGVSESGDSVETIAVFTAEPTAGEGTDDIAVDQPQAVSGAKAIPAVAVRPKITSDKVLETYGPTIEEASRKYAVDSTLIYSVIMTESGGDPQAVSPKGAKGLMQLMDATAEQLGVADSLNPQQNIDGGAKYLRRLLDKYDGDLKRTLAAYNAGPGAVDKHKGVPPYAETRRYVDKVMGHLSRMQRRSSPVTNPKGNQPESRQE